MIVPPSLRLYSSVSVSSLWFVAIGDAAFKWHGRNGNYELQASSHLADSNITGFILKRDEALNPPVNVKHLLVLAAQMWELVFMSKVAESCSKQMWRNRPPLQSLSSRERWHSETCRSVCIFVSVAGDRQDVDHVQAAAEVEQPDTPTQPECCPV